MRVGKTPSSCAARWACMRSCTRPFTSILFVGADFGLQFNLIVPEFLQKYYLWAGLPAFIILVRAGGHVVPLGDAAHGQELETAASLHLSGRHPRGAASGLVIKGDFFRLGGDVWKPFVAAIVIGGLLIVRIPRVRHALLSLKHGALTPNPDRLPPRSNPNSRRIDVRRLDPRRRR